MPDVQADQNRRDLLNDAGIFQLAAVDGADAGNLGGKFARQLRRIGIVTADNDIAVERYVSVEQISREIMKCGNDADFFRHHFGSLLCREDPCHTPRGAQARPPMLEASCMNGSIDQNATFGDQKV